MERLLCVMLGFAEILTGFWSNVYKVDTCLKRTHWVGPTGVPYTQISLYYISSLFVKKERILHLVKICNSGFVNVSGVSLHLFSCYHLNDFLIAG